jgi:hypothetical protein
MVFVGDIPLAIWTPRRILEDFTTAIGAGDRGLLVLTFVLVLVVRIPIGVHGQTFVLPSTCLGSYGQ